MSDNVNEMLGRMAVASLHKCVEKLSKVSAGVWSVAGYDVSTGTLGEAMKRRGPDDGEALAVYFEVKGELPFVAITLFDPRDIGRISRCFLGYSFFVSTVLNQTGELLLSELSSIILNSFVGAFSNNLKQVFMPSASRLLRGKPQGLLDAVGAVIDVTQRFHIISIKLDVQCDAEVTRSEVLGLIPEKLALALKIDEKDQSL